MYEVQSTMYQVRGTTYKEARDKKQEARQRAVRFLCVLAPLREKEKRDKREYQVASTKY